MTSYCRLVLEGIINIVDATNLERNLYLTMQLMELGIPMVPALNMMDEVRENGGSIRINELEAILGMPVVPISAAKNEGVEELISHVIHVACYRRQPTRIDFCTDSRESADPIAAVHRAIHATVHIIEPEANAVGMPARFAATKLIEKDALMAARLQIPADKDETFRHIISIMEQESGLMQRRLWRICGFHSSRDSAGKRLSVRMKSKEHRRSVAIDRILTGHYTAVPSFVAIMGFIFAMTFNGVGALLSDLMEMVVKSVTDGLDAVLVAADVNPVVHSLMIDGVAAGTQAAHQLFADDRNVVFLFVYPRGYRLWRPVPSWTDGCR